ncbi:class I SAM-dependent methyltransferase [Paenibacillus sp. y28]|uniref:class I SAM-dependent methyltransferase n=1 Tax=Paenibacillus sp. y28 TaxID=3129110 RepID=UPI003018761D
MYMENHKEKWDELHQMSVFNPLYPTESVVRFVKSAFSEPERTHLLDLGCGAGRHVVFLAKEGYQVTGIDFSLEGLELTRAKLAQERLHAKLVHSSILPLPFEDASFDGIIAYGVLIYFMPDDIRAAAKEMHRVLKPGGKAFIVVRSTDDKRYGLGEEIEAHTFRMNNLNEENFVVHYFTAEEISTGLFSEFAGIQIGFANDDLGSLTAYNSNYLVTLMK